MSGILKVTATERATGLAKHVVIDSATERFRQRQRSDAVGRLDALLGSADQDDELFRPVGEWSDDDEVVESLPADAMAPSLLEAIDAARAMTAKADQLLPAANAEDAEELRAMLDDLRASVELRSEHKIRDVLREVEDLVFYLQDA